MTAPATSAAAPAVAPVAGSVCGAGPFADALRRHVDVPHGVTLVVARLDEIVVPENAETVVSVGLWRGFAYVGPVWRPGRAGCPDCLVARVANSPFGPDRTGVDVRRGSAAPAATDALGPHLRHTVTTLVRLRLADLAAAPGTVSVVDGVTGSVERQVLLPDAICRTCGTPATATEVVFSDPDTDLAKLTPRTLRTRNLPLAIVERDYLFSGIGLFKELRQDLQSPFGACSVELPDHLGRREPSIGRADSYARSRVTAVLEGLERYAGLHRGARGAPVRAAYQDVADRAVPPTRFGVHPPESYATPGFRYRPFRPDVVVDWVPAYSFRRDAVRLVPERAAYWGPRHDGEPTFFYDTSNGCALGNSVEEAVLHGLREVAERDAFLLTWYRKLALPEVPLSDTDDPELSQLLRKCMLFTGCRFRAFLSTMEYSMPSFWLVAESADGSGPTVLAGSCAHPDPKQALAGGLHELTGSVLAARHGYPARRADGLRMLADPDLVRQMPDHSLVGSLPEARDRFAFLLDGDRPTVGLADVPATVRDDLTDLRGDLATAVGGVLGIGLDVLVVDQTMPELARNGLHCVKVLVPGLVPMTFGHRNRRTHGLPRLTDGTGLPYPAQLRVGEEVGCVPHPFP